MSICPKNKSSKARRDKRRANWKMSAPNLVKCSKCGELMMLLQQKRDHSSGLRTTETMRKKDQEECPVAVFFLIFFNWGQGIFNLGRGISENTTSPIE